MVKIQGHHFLLSKNPPLQFTERFQVPNWARKKKGPERLFKVYKEWNTTQLCGDDFRNYWKDQTESTTKKGAQKPVINGFLPFKVVFFSNFSDFIYSGHENVHLLFWGGRIFLLPEPHRQAVGCSGSSFPLLLAGMATSTFSKGLSVSHKAITLVF